MKESKLTKKIDRREFLRDMALVGGAAFVTASPVGALAQSGKKQIPPIDVLYYTIIPEQEDIWKLVVQDWKKLGIEPKLKVAVNSVVLSACFKSHKYGDIASISWAPTTSRFDPSYHLEEQLHSKRAYPGARNYGYYKNPEYDKYVDLQNEEMDRNKRRELVWKCQEIQANDYPVWWMAYGANIQAYNSRDWEGVVPMAGVGIGARYGTPWTFLKMKSKTKRNKLRVADITGLFTTNFFRAHNSPDIQTLAWIYDTHVKVGPNMETVPWAAESWRVVNDTTVDITLRSGMKFHDGKPVTVQDVKFTWDYARKWQFPMYNWVSGTVKRAQILDDRNIRYHLVKPNAAFVDKTLTMAIIAPKHIWEKIPESVGVKNPMDWENPKCIGSGFFKFGYLRKGEELYLEANKEHFHAPNIDGAYFRLRMTPDAMVSALIAGEADILGGDIRLSQAKQLDRYDYLTIVKADNHRLWMARPDMRKKPFDDREFRRALYHAINLNKIHEVVFEGTGNEGRNTPIAPIFKFWHNPNLKVEFSIDKARKILKDAGYTWDSDGRLCFPKGA